MADIPDSAKSVPSSDLADILVTIQNAADDWQKQGYPTALAEVRDMANVGRALMSAIADNAGSPPLKGWHPADCPSEIVSDLLNMLDDATRAARPAMDREAVVKPLDWRVIGQLSAYAEAATGATYAVQEFFGWDNRFQLVCREADDAKTRTTFWHTLAEAKAAAQSDHAARILSTLSADAIRQGEGCEVERLQDTLERLIMLTPSRANASNAHDLHASIRAIAETALSKSPGYHDRPNLRNTDPAATPASHASDGGEA